MEKTAKTLREKLVGNIIYYSGDEYESKQDYVALAMLSNEKLVDKLINILDYYYDKCQELS